LRTDAAGRVFNAFRWNLIFVSELRRRQFRRKRKIAGRLVATPAHLDELIEEATVDCHDDNEQASGSQHDPPAAAAQESVGSACGQVAFRIRVAAGYRPLLTASKVPKILEFSVTGAPSWRLPLGFSDQ
jgi:hypothetical protein